MRKPWSITTTVRNPLRIKDFLKIAAELCGRPWNRDTQKEYQKLLIQKRLYGFDSVQFYNGLPAEITSLIDDTDAEIPMEAIDEILRIKNYADFDMRGRQSMNPLTKFGFIRIDDDTKIISLTDSGCELLDTDDNEIGKVLLRSFLKWQIPNPASRDYPEEDGYSGIPFVLALRLISRVNELEEARGNNGVGLQKREFALFATTLTNYTDIEPCANMVIELRDLQNGHDKQERKTIRDNYRLRFARYYLNTTDSSTINKFLKNLNDYGDNAIRYFRLTNFIRIRGGGFYVDIEPSRLTEINALFESEWYKPKEFTDKNVYLDYLCASTEPQYPWETEEKLRKIANTIQEDVIKLGLEENEVIIPVSFDGFSSEELKTTIEDLRKRRNELRNKSDHDKAQPAESIAECIKQFDDIYTNDEKSRALMLEYLSTMGLHAFNDAISVKPNYPIGDDNEPTSTAPGGVPDIECVYNSFGMVCEVTMLRNRSQWFNEGQPVMRHLRDFEASHNNSYCLFIAPSIHTDTAETFYMANNFGYKGQRQKIAPITISQFVGMLQTLKQMREDGKAFHNSDMKELLDKIVNESTTENDSERWIANIPQLVINWQNSLLNR